MKIHISHGAGNADGVWTDEGYVGETHDWFVVMPDPRIDQAMHDAQVESLRQAGRTVIELEVEPWNGKDKRSRQPKPVHKFPFNLFGR